MKKTIVFLTGIFILSYVAKAQNTETINDKFDELISYMQGSFSSEDQAKRDTNYLHITLEMRRIWNSDNNGVWLYVEQTAAWTPGKPYRQRIYHIEQVNDSIFTSTILKMPNKEQYVGGHLNPIIFDSLSSDSLEVLEGCALSLKYSEGCFEGSTDGDNCKNSWQGASYATSEVSICKEYMMSWDRGWNASDEHIWGVANSGYIFSKK